MTSWARNRRQVPGGMRRCSGTTVSSTPGSAPTVIGTVDPGRCRARVAPDAGGGQGDRVPAPDVRVAAAPGRGPRPAGADEEGQDGDGGHAEHVTGCREGGRDQDAQGEQDGPDGDAAGRREHRGSGGDHGVHRVLVGRPGTGVEDLPRGCHPKGETAPRRFAAQRAGNLRCTGTFRAPSQLFPGEVPMMWLWLTLVWMALACVAGVVLGGALRTAERNDRLRVEVDTALRREFAEL